MVMHLPSIVRKIQYQAAKLEVIELLFLYSKNNQASVETEMAYSAISILQKIYSAPLNPALLQL